MGVMTMDHSHGSPGNQRRMAARLHAAGWGAFFLWVGIALLANVEWGVGLLGVGLITLAGQAARSHFELPLEGFWLFVGTMFCLGGVWELFQVELHLAPVLMVIAGVGLLLSALRR